MLMKSSSSIISADYKKPLSDSGIAEEEHDDDFIYITLNNTQNSEGEHEDNKSTEVMPLSPKTLSITENETEEETISPAPTDLTPTDLISTETTPSLIIDSAIQIQKSAVIVETKEESLTKQRAPLDRKKPATFNIAQERQYLSPMQKIWEMSLTLFCCCKKRSNLDPHKKDDDTEKPLNLPPRLII